MTVLRWLTIAALALSACAGARARPETSCPGEGSTPEALFAVMAERGIPGAPESVRFHFEGEEIAVGWKNLLSGRELTLSCAYRREARGWHLLRARLDEGTHTLRITRRANPPALVYRDAAGRLLDVVALPSTDSRRTP